jgi:hypothetical protein
MQRHIREPPHKNPQERSHLNLFKEISMLLDFLFKDSSYLNAIVRNEENKEEKIPVINADNE